MEGLHVCLLPLDDDDDEDGDDENDNDGTVMMAMVMLDNMMMKMMMAMMMMMLVKPDITVSGWNDGMSLITRILLPCGRFTSIENQSPNHVAMWWACVERRGGEG